MNPVLASLIRLLRAGVAIAVPIVIQHCANSQDPKLLALAPVLMAVGKYLRDVFKWEWLPV